MNRGRPPARFLVPISFVIALAVLIACGRVVGSALPSYSAVPSPTARASVGPGRSAQSDQAPGANATANRPATSSGAPSPRPSAPSAADTIVPSTPLAQADPNAAPTGLDPATEAALAQARHLRSEGNFTGALDSYRRVTANARAPLVAILEQGEVELALNDAPSARDDGEKAVTAVDPAVQARARFLVASADLSLGRDDEVPRLVDVATAPDGLADFAVLRRAQAAAKAGSADAARQELGRPELRGSTNRVILESAGQLANALNRPGLAAELEARAGSFPGWTADRARDLQAASRDAAKGGEAATEIAADRRLIESFGWTTAATWAGSDLERVGALAAYDRALLAINGKSYAEARTALQQAESGPDAAAAAAQLAILADAEAWQSAQSANTSEAYASFASSHPASPHRVDALFAAGLARYQAGQYADALAAWSSSDTCAPSATTPPAPSAGACGDALARQFFWSGKALIALGRTADARSAFERAAATTPTGYYALRARDALAGTTGWPTTGPTKAADSVREQAEVEAWITAWAGPQKAAAPSEAARVQRGLGLLALGDPTEATAELNGVIADSHDPWLLDRLARTLAQDELWASSARAANRLVSLSPAKVVPDAPLGVQRLAYPPAYLNLVRSEAARRGIDPLLFLSLMYQESADDPLALSTAGARGLTQVMPTTGAGVASAIGMKGFTPADLDHPTTAVQIGVWFFANQLHAFGGDPFRAFAAYNAGARPIAIWAAADPDLFIERITAAETKDYVRKIYVHNAEYRALIGE